MIYKGIEIMNIDGKLYIQEEDSFIEFNTVQEAKEYITSILD